MGSFYKSHGKHCYYRSFQTTCSRCGVDVLYWECRHGCKMFFTYPPYGKLIRHRCRVQLGKNSKRKFQIIVKTPSGLLEKASPSCPICGKLFKNNKDLESHLKQLKKIDFQHRKYFEEKIPPINENGQEKLKEFIKTKSNARAKFGTINIKKRNQ